MTSFQLPSGITSEPEHNPQDVAENMIRVRGFEQALVRAIRYAHGSIKSEQPREFWLQVHKHIAECKSRGNLG